ncbi:hypothetical protein R6Q59_014937 [Mikania micrantha]
MLMNGFFGIAMLDVVPCMDSDFGRVSRKGRVMEDGDFVAVSKGVNKPIKGVIVGLIGSLWVSSRVAVHGSFKWVSGLFVSARFRRGARKLPNKLGKLEDLEELNLEGAASITHLPDIILNKKGLTV